MQFAEILKIVVGEATALEFLAERTKPYILVAISDNEIRAIGLDESGDWRQSSISNLYYRVDPQNDAQKQKRHVHIAHKKHIHAPGEQFSWCDDGLRHDSHNFNSNFSGMASAKRLAAKFLKLSSPNILESIDFVPEMQHLQEGRMQASSFYYFITVAIRVRAGK